MKETVLEPITNRPTMVIAILVLLALLGWFGVSRLVNRFQQEEKALARHLYRQGLEEQQSGKQDLAIEHFRAALGYDGDNFQYQLSLARALRDGGRTEEAGSYLISLWERFPQSGEVNLALGRLAAREGSLDRVMQYYHNAIYGLWVSDAEQNRARAWLELIAWLLRWNARAQAQAELIGLSANLPPNPELALRTATLFARVQDYEHALAHYRRVLESDPANPSALAGAGEAAYQLSRYRTAVQYLQAAAKASPRDAHLTEVLTTSKLILQEDPFNRGISTLERDRRLRIIFHDAGQRLDTCMHARAQPSNPQPQADPLPALKARWSKMKSQLASLRSSRESALPDEIMDLVLQIEQQTAACGTTVEDQALLLLAENRAGVEQ
ncbi:MAG TPA: tetratricopeptide repeat protein [Terriglobales bacterium]|nr:tetratricopeptide repeat protein [Terriglobales bacterium]